MRAPRKKLIELPGLETYEKYEVDTDGNIWSHKGRFPRVLKTGWAKRKDLYRTVTLKNTEGKQRSFYVHRLVAEAFLPNPTDSWGIYHKDGNLRNNSLDNLEWIGKRLSNNELDTDSLVLSQEMSDYIKLVHRACIEKGIPVPTDYEFFHGMLNESLEEYISRYGLKKMMYSLSVSQ